MFVEVACIRFPEETILKLLQELTGFHKLPEEYAFQISSANRNKIQYHKSIHSQGLIYYAFDVSTTN